jgi:D-serine deaminase-like pyridoxal phosphate-dependent protein
MKHVELLAQAFDDERKVLEVLIEFETEDERTGVKPQNVQALAEFIQSKKALKFKGLFTHEGHDYGATSREQLVTIAKEAGQVMVETARVLERTLGLEGLEPNKGTLAEGIAIAAPARHKQLLDTLYKTGGSILSVSEEAIEPARAFLASRGYYVELTTVINYAGYLKAKATMQADQKVIIPLCGAGLKSD